MGVEIERKFLVIKDKWELQAGKQGTLYRQAYVFTSPEKVLRVRLEGEQAKLTLKAAVSDRTRLEYEYDIPREEAEEMMDKLCDTEVRKIRYKINFEGKLWEIDVFEGDNEGLIVAEIELESEEEDFEYPAWLGTEVTEDQRYYNAALAKLPFNQWQDES